MLLVEFSYSQYHFSMIDTYVKRLYELREDITSVYLVCNDRFWLKSNSSAQGRGLEGSVTLWNVLHPPSHPDETLAKVCRGPSLHRRGPLNQHPNLEAKRALLVTR